MQLMIPSERTTHNPAPCCPQGIVSINSSDLGPCPKGGQKNTQTQYAGAHTRRIGLTRTHHAGKPLRSKHGLLFGGGDEVDASTSFPPRGSRPGFEARNSRAIAGAVCPQELVRMNLSDLLCAGMGAPYKRVVGPFPWKKTSVGLWRSRENR